MKHFKYLRYLLRHKFYVFVECCKYRLFWQGIIHDWSKLLPSEWFPYARYFYGDYPNAPEVFRLFPSYTGLTKQVVENQLDRAWLHHQHWNKHHWQHYILREDEGDIKVLEMPMRYRKEMLADWIGAGKALGNPDVTEWFVKHKHRGKMLLESETKLWIDETLGLED